MKGLSKGRYDETFAGEDDKVAAVYQFALIDCYQIHIWITFIKL